MGCNYFFLPLVPASGTQLLISEAIYAPDQHGSVRLQAGDDRHRGPPKPLTWPTACSVGQQTHGVWTKASKEERAGKESTQTQPKSGLFSIRFDIETEVHSAKFDSNTGRSVSWFANHIFHVWRNFTWKLSSPWYHTLGWWHRFDYRQIKDKPGNLRH